MDNVWRSGSWTVEFGVRLWTLVSKVCEHSDNLPEDLCLEVSHRVTLDLAGANRGCSKGL